MDVTPQQARTILTTVRLTLAAGWLTPGLTAKVFGIDLSENRALPFLGRLFAVRDGYMGVQLLEQEGDDLDRVLQLGIAVDALDAVAAGLAGVRGQLPKRAAIMAGATALAAVALGVRARQG
jgi:hypothetical protein